MSKQKNVGALSFRIALFIAAASLAAYIPYKFATSLHAMQGMYAFLFPLSGFLAIAGMALAVKPMACDCGVGVRSGIAGLSVLWGAVGVLCTGSLIGMIIATPAAGLFATFHMLTQHVFLPASLLAFAFAPAWLMPKLGYVWSAASISTETVTTDA